MMWAADIERRRTYPLVAIAEKAFGLPRQVQDLKPGFYELTATCPFVVEVGGSVQESAYPVPASTPRVIYLRGSSLTAAATDGADGTLVVTPLICIG